MTKWGVSLSTTPQVEEPLPVLRRTLASATNHSVSYVSVGFLNNLAELLASPPDTISPLTGQQLVEQKVSWSHLSSFHQRLIILCTNMVQVALVAVMGGAYPSSEDLPFGGTEFNFDCGRVGPLIPIPFFSAVWGRPWSAGPRPRPPSPSSLQGSGWSSQGLR